jgi:hypothetical protein
VRQRRPAAGAEKSPVTTRAPNGAGSCLAALNLPAPRSIESAAPGGGYPAMTAIRQALNSADGDLPAMKRKKQTPN